jgi:phenylacetate-CoA ligase
VPFITLNAFSMGAWATGVNMGLALQKHSLVKNTGPDVEKILHTLKAFGPAQPYLITGYPPFLKLLMDSAEKQGFDLGPYRLWALVGGEGMSEGLRDYLGRRFEKVYSGYGATDLEIGIAGETPLAVALRRLAQAQPRLKEALFGEGSRIPMLFQYNPLMHEVEVDPQGELLITINRPSLVSPRIRYNIHDEGGVLAYDGMETLLRSLGLDIEGLVPDGPRSLKLPFLWVYGRKDHTISVMGANIYPEDLEQCLYGEPELAALTRSYCMGLSEGPDAEVRPSFAFEVDGPRDGAQAQRFAEAMLRGLTRLNADFRAALAEHPATLQPKVRLFGPGEGPFAEQQGRIKQIRLLKQES